jgi:hypothetical protein
MAHTVDGRMNYTIGPLQCRLEAHPGSKINTGTPAY